MPVYEYECQACGIRFERKQSFSDEPIKVCPECQGPTRRVLYPVGIVFKGSGFYITDSRSSDKATVGSKESVTGTNESSESHSAGEQAKSNVTSSAERD